LKIHHRSAVSRRQEKIHHLQHGDHSFPANSSQSSPVQPCWQFSSVQPCFSQEPSTRVRQHSTTNLCPQISSTDYSQPEETKEWKPPYSPAYSVKTASQWPNDQYPKLKRKLYKKERSSFNNNWSKSPGQN